MPRGWNYPVSDFRGYLVDRVGMRVRTDTNHCTELSRYASLVLGER